MHRALRLWISLSLLSFLACSGNACKGAAAVRQEARPASPLPDPWRYARMDVRDSEVPARFRAPIPDLTRGEENAWTPEYPPRAHVKDALCAGDPDMGERLVESVDRAVASGAGTSEIVRSYADLFSHCGTGSCAWARGVVLDTKRSAAAREVAWFGLTGCNDPETAALFEKQEAPAFAYISYLDNLHWRGPTASTPVPFSPKLERAASEAVRREADSPSFILPRTAALLLGETDSPRAAEVLLKLHAETADASRRDTLAAAMYRQSHPKARALFQALCARDREPLCEQDKSSGLETPADPREQLRQEALSPAGFAQREDVGALEAHLDGLGLTALPGKPVPEEPPLTAEEVLLARGRAHVFDVETGMFPNAHDSLLRDLAALAPEVLTGFVFEEVPPTLEEDEAGTGSYRLIAWGGGKRYETKAQALGDWYDLEAVLTFLNALARARGSEVRWLSLATGDQVAHVVAGPSQALSSLLDSGLVQSGDSDEARSAGREFEEEVLRRLQQEGATLAE